MIFVSLLLILIPLFFFFPRGMLITLYLIYSLISSKFFIIIIYYIDFNIILSKKPLTNSLNYVKLPGVSFNLLYIKRFSIYYYTIYWLSIRGRM
jgi:hypothetical protein